MPRPFMLTPGRHQTIVNAIRLGATREDAARSAGIGVSTLHSWTQDARNWRNDHGPDENPEDPDLLAMVELLDEIEKADSQLFTAMAGRVVQAANNGQWQAAAWLLERRRHADYGRKTEVTGAGGGPVEVSVTAREALEEVLARMLPPDEDD